jgi:hypothetical protein
MMEGLNPEFTGYGLKEGDGKQNLILLNSRKRYQAQT